jgi:hypothetical protein
MDYRLLVYYRIFIPNRSSLAGQCIHCSSSSNLILRLLWVRNTITSIIRVDDSDDASTVDDNNLNDNDNEITLVLVLAHDRSWKMESKH